MSEAVVRANETTVPMLPCVSPEETLAFYRALGFEVTYEQTRPYLYLAVEWSGFGLHFTKPAAGVDAAKEDAGGCLVMVDAVAPYHAAFTEAMRQAYGKVLSSGRPRITRYRPGASRFTLVDPSGNSVIFIQRDEPQELEYGGSKKLTGLAKALDNARILREFKGDDRAAFRAVTSGLRRHGAKAAAVDRALALATLMELATALGESGQIEAWAAELHAIELTDAERRRVESELGQVAALERWRADVPPASEAGGLRGTAPAPDGD
ncbi:glyoxalase [Streptomyces sp. ISL-43]|uniref:glyoxalase n=1 Tax=Streptomyces sp. ISL-43 TaxID=2819183 RepID=UPI001BEC0675|nr:glyoxalase [Streptomyces sp. ISL-43]MBT2452808.1 glyoxalase [Streptomyces sp. ISL-43]